MPEACAVFAKVCKEPENPAGELLVAIAGVDGDGDIDGNTGGDGLLSADGLEDGSANADCKACFAASNVGWR